MLHNVGNVLNENVNVSTTLAVQKVKESEVSSLVKVGEMIRANRADLPAF